MPEGTKRRVRLFLGICGIAGAGGIAFGVIAGIAYFPERPLLGASFGALAALLSGIVFVSVIVGDEVVITWTLANGRSGARPIACYFAVKRALELAAKDFEREFGSVPQLWAALHAGPVITGEVGGSRRAIVFHGDVMNTTSRLENATRDLGRPFLVSEDALSRLDGREACKSVDLGPHQLRGRAAPVHVYAVELGMEAIEATAHQ